MDDEPLQTWVAFGDSGAVGSIHRTSQGFVVRMLAEDAPRGAFPALDVAKSALHSALGPGAEWPDFREH